MNIDFILDNLQKNSNHTIVISDTEKYTYLDIYKKYIELKKIPIKDGSVVLIIGDFSALSIALILALIEKNCIIVPVSPSSKRIEEYKSISESEYIVEINNDINITKTLKTSNHNYILDLKSKNSPGIIFFSSGTTGEPKAALHNLELLMEKFKKPGKSLRTITFLLFDHIGGFNTMMHTITSGGTIVTINSRVPDIVCHAIEKHKVELLPTSPTFLNMMLLSKAYEKYDMSSLKIISYGTEAMPEITLKTLCRIFPTIKFKQTYGLSELGIMSTQCEASDSLWMKLGGEGFEVKVIDEILYIRAKSAMIGYLNAPSPFDEKGWFNTQDKVLVKDGYIKILGRVSDLINIGGEKVYPIEIENELLKCEGVLDAKVYAENNPLSGKMIAAEIHVAKENKNREFIKKLRIHCKNNLDIYKIPARFILKEETLTNERLKKNR